MYVSCRDVPISECVKDLVHVHVAHCTAIKAIVEGVVRYLSRDVTTGKLLKPPHHPRMRPVAWMEAIVVVMAAVFGLSARLCVAQRYMSGKDLAARYAHVTAAAVQTPTLRFATCSHTRARNGTP